MAVGTISSTLSHEVVLGNGTYQTALTITTTGQIAAPAPVAGFQTAAAIYAAMAGAGIVNKGVVKGAVPANPAYVAPAILAANPITITNYGTVAGQSGIYLNNGGALSNSGSISGTQGAGGGYGVRLTAATMQNSGQVYGVRYGVAERNGGSLANSGGIAGGTAGVRLLSAAGAPATTLTNSGSIGGGVSGIKAASATVTNSGTVNGQRYGIYVTSGGAIVNRGQITGGQDGVFLLNQLYQAKTATTLLNYGSIHGTYMGLALNLDDTATNAAGGVISATDFGAGVGDAGYLRNAGSIDGGVGGLAVEAGGLAVNAGTITSRGIGLDLFYASNATNAASGYVYSAHTAAIDPAAYLLNLGTISGVIYGLELASGGIAVNRGSILSQTEGIYLTSLNATTSPDFAVNFGYVYGRALAANLKNGTLYNYGTIAGQQVGVTLVAGTSFQNDGVVLDQRYGVQLSGGTLQNNGFISAGVNGAVMSHGYLVNAGTIAGVKHAVYGTSFALVVEPGAVFQGGVLDKSGSGTLVLGGATPGTLSGLGSAISGFRTLDFEPGAHWLVSGTAAALTAWSMTSILGFEPGDTIVLNGFSASNNLFVLNRGLELWNSSTSRTLAILGSFTTANFNVASTAAGTTVTLNPGAPCFAAGTRILTPRGEVAVEALRVGDRVVTLGGEDRPVIWIGRRTVDLDRHPRPQEAQPVCIAADAMAEQVPRRDLWLSPDHALFIDGALVPAQLLLNGLSIYQAARAQVTYYHIELSGHQVIFAENAAVESYLDTGNRAAFENGADDDLAPAALAPAPLSASLRARLSCAEMLAPGAKLDAIRRGILRRCGPWLRRLG